MTATLRILKKDKTSQHKSIRAPNLLKTNVSGESSASSASSVSSVNSVNSVNSVSSVSSVGRVLKQATFITYFPEDNCLCSSSPDFATKMILMLLFSRQIKMSSPNLNNVIIIGCILCYSRWSKIVQSLPQKSIHRLLQNIRKYNPPKYFQRNHSRSRLLYHINQRFSVHLHSQGKQVKWWQWCTGCPKKNWRTENNPSQSKHLKGQLWPRVGDVFLLFLPHPPPPSQRSVVTPRW